MNKKVIVLFVTFIFFNIFFVYQILVKQRTENVLKKQIELHEKQKLTKSMLRGYPLLPKVDLKSLTNNNKLFLITIVKADISEEVLSKIMGYLDKLSKNYREYIRVYYGGQKKRLVKYSVKFDIYELMYFPEKFALVDYGSVNSISFVVDKNGYPQIYNETNTDELESLSEFFSRVESLFQTVYEK